ncbi:MAG: hypothetical protein IT306_00405 [Chloroflexi bacterium]|nr:hypothetical protein [Chloroflexota bacterium]
MPIFRRPSLRLDVSRRLLPLPILALGASLAGQLALDQRAWLGGAILLLSAALLIGSAALGRDDQPDDSADEDAEARFSEDAEAHADRHPDPGTLIGGWRGLLSLLVVGVGAAACRLVLLGALPPGLAPAEAVVGLDAAHVLSSGFDGGTWDGWPIFHLLTVWSVGALGHTPVAVRLPAALGGTLMALALFLLGRQLGGTLLGALAGMLAALLFWPVELTRAAFGYVGWGVAAQALGVALLMRAAQRGHGGLAGAAGVAIGLGIQVSWSGLMALVAALILACRPRAGSTRWQPPQPPVLAPFLVYGLIAAGPVIAGVSIPDRHLAVERATNANPSEAAAPLLERLRATALMFNVSGDPDPVHNAQGQKHLDSVMAALLILGIAVAVARPASRRGGILLLWLAVTLALAARASRDSGPDSLAAFPMLAPVALLAASGLVAVAGQLPGRMWTAPMWRLDLLVVLLGFSVVTNGYTTFIARRTDQAAWTGYASAEALTAEQINRLLPTHAIYLADVWLDHPTIRFLAPGLGEPRPLDAAVGVPLRRDETFAYFAPGRQEVVAEDLERVYEDGEIDRYRSPLDDTQVVLRTFRAPSKVVASARGVTLRVTSQDRSRTSRQTLGDLRLSWPIPGESAQGAAIELFAALAIDTPGWYRFMLDGPPGSTVEINGVSVGRAGEELTTELPAGNQRLRVLAAPSGPAQIQLRWQPPGTSELTAIPGARLSREQRTATGLLAVYRSGTDPEAKPDVLRFERYVQREATLPPLAGPYVLDLIGVVDAPKAGTYRFRVQGSGNVGLWLDDLPVPLGQSPGDEPASVVLPDGDHSIRVRLTNPGSDTTLNLLWAPPGEDWGAIPTSRFTPVSNPTEAAIHPAIPPDPAIRALGATRVASLVSLESEPRAVAVGPDGAVYVTNASTRDTLRIDSPSSVPTPIPNAEAGVPADVEVGPDGVVWVLDALDGQLRRIEPATGEVRTVGSRDLGLYRPRGFGLAPDGTLLVADTGGSRLVHLAPDGSMLGKIGPAVGGPVELRQPTDVVVAPNGDIYAVNGEGGSVLHLSPTGAYLHHWAVLPADTERGPHMAIAPDGAVWISEPDGRRISRFTPAGVPAGVVDQTREGRLLRAPVGIAIGPNGLLYVTDVSLRAVLALRFGP